MIMLARTFPLIQRPAVPLQQRRIEDKPVLWIIPGESVLSSDTECLKWQAYLALCSQETIAIRTDISPSGALENKLPNLFIPSTSTLLPAHHIPSYVTPPPTSNESHAWFSLLEGPVHSALLLAKQANQSYFDKLFSLEKETPIEALITPPPAPLTGFASLIPANMGTKVNVDAIISQYREAIASLSERLATDKWFLNSEQPTALDALIFAYLHIILTSNYPLLRIEVTKRVNLVAWEYRVRRDVQAAYVK